MVYSDTVTKQGLIQDISFLLGVDLNNYTIEDRTRNINERFRTVWSIIFDGYGGMKFQDDNLNAAPYSDVSIASGTGTGSLPTGALTVREVQLKDANGVYRKIRCITEQEYFEMGADARWNGQTGQPTFIFFYEDIWKLLPAPNYTLASALRIYFDQEISTFSTSDTTKVPGFASPFHRILSIGGALDYALSHGLADKVAYLQTLWNDYAYRLKGFYAKRYQARYPHALRSGEDIMETYT